jgi:rhodanese-related sulfurtransferase
MEQIDVSRLRILLEQDPSIVLIDVREEYEHEAFNIGGKNIPLGEIMQAVTDIPADQTVVIYCKRGIRSAIAIQRLQERFGFTNLLNLQGGLEEWKTTGS